MDFNKPKIKMKSKGLLIVSYFEKTENKLFKIDEKIIPCTKKELTDSLKDTKIKIEYVAERPTHFQMGVFYILETTKGRPTYIYTHQIN